MKHVWHLFLKDLARVKPFAAALVLLAGLRPLLGLAAIVQDDFAYGEATRYENLDLTLLILHAVGVWLLALWLAQLDSPRRPDAFLHTRPVSRGALWTAKLLGAWILCALAPLLVWLPWWLGCGMAGADLRALAISHVSGLALLTIPALTLGALVRDYRRAVLWSVAVAVVIMCLPVLLTSPGESKWRYLSNREWVLRFGAWLILGSSAVLTLLCLLYRRHPRRAGFAVWVAAALALGGAFHRTDWPAVEAPADPHKRNGSPPAGTVKPQPETTPWRDAAAFPGLRVDFTSLKRSLTDVVSEQGIRKMPVYTLRVRATGTDGLVPQIGIESIAYSARDGTSVRSRNDILFPAFLDDFSALFPRLSQGTPADAPSAGKNFTGVWIDSPLDTLSGPLTVHADLCVKLLRPVLVSRHTLAPTGWHRAGGIGYRIRDVREATESGRGVELSLVKTEFCSHGLWALWHWSDPYDPLRYLHVFDGQGRWVSEYTHRSSPIYTVAGVQVRHDTTLVQPARILPPDGESIRSAFTPEWQAGLSYASVRLDPVARVRLEMNATDLVVERED